MSFSSSYRKITFFWHLKKRHFSNLPSKLALELFNELIKHVQSKIEVDILDINR